MKLVRGDRLRKRDILYIISLSVILLTALTITFSEINTAMAATDITIINTGSAITEPDTRQVTRESARYSFASSQETSCLKVIPGEETESDIFFYNIDGNRTTWIILKVADAPDGWGVEIDPPLCKQYYQENGKTSGIEANLLVEPAGPVSGELKDLPHGMTCFILSGRGYIPASTATVTIKVPVDEERGTTGNIRISAEARWTGQTTGGGIISQTRDFDFQVEIVE